MTLEVWKDTMKTLHPEVTFVQCDGRGTGYGALGDWTAMVGPSPLTDVVGAYTVDGHSVTAEGSLRVYLSRL